MTRSDEFAPMTPMRVTVTDIRMPFTSMVAFMVKWALASIPAVIILTAVMIVVGLLSWGVLAGAVGAFTHPAKAVYSDRP